MSESETEQQPSWEDVITFHKSLGHSVLRWPWRDTRETKIHRQWRMYASVVKRFRLYANVLPIEYGMTRAFFAAEDAERAAHAKMIDEKHALALRYLTGKRKSPPPPWGC